MADRLRQLYHRYDLSEYFQLKIEFSDDSTINIVLGLLLLLWPNRQHGSAALWTVVRPTCKVNGMWPIFTPWHQNPRIFFSNLNLTSTIMSARSTLVQIFISIRSAGASLQIGEILRFCDLFLVGWSVILYFFSRKRAKFEPVDEFSGLWLIRRVFAQGRSFWGCDLIGIRLG